MPGTDTCARFDVITSNPFQDVPRSWMASFATLELADLFVALLELDSPAGQRYDVVLVTAAAVLSGAELEAVERFGFDQPEDDDGRARA